MRCASIHLSCRWLSALVLLPLMCGCGGVSTGGSNLHVGAGGTALSRKSKITRFDVNVATGKVKISASDAYGRAILTGGAVTFSSSDLLTVGGDSGKRHLALAITNNSNEAFSSGRVVIGGISNVTTNAVKSSVIASTTAGSGAIGHADGVGLAATFQNAVGIAAGDGPSLGSYFISDSGNSTIRQLFPDGTVTTFAGLALNPGGTDGNGLAARFNKPGQVAVDGYGDVFVADTGNHTIRRITPLGEVSTIAGIVGTAGHNDGAGNVATFSSPSGIAVSFFGDHIYVSESNDIRQVLLTGAGPRNVAASYTTAPIAGSASPGFVDANASAARFNNPNHLAFAANGISAGIDLFVTDTGNNAVRRVQDPDLAGAPVTTIAGGNGAGSTDGAGSVAQFDSPSGIAVVPPAAIGGDFALFVANKNGGLIRFITYVAGNGHDEAGNYNVTTLTSGSGYHDGDGSLAKFANPFGIAAVELRTAGPGPSATLEIVDQGNQRIRKVNLANGGLTSGGVSSSVTEPVRVLNWDQELPNGSSLTVAWAKSFQNIQNGVDLQFYVPAGVSGFSFTAYIEADTQLVNLPGVGASYMTTLAGNGTPGDSDGPGRLAQFNGPFGIAVAPPPAFSAFRAVVADQQNHRIRALDARGGLSTIAGNAAGFLDGPANTAQFNGPRGIAAGLDGSLYVADAGNRRIRRIASVGGQLAVTTIAGTGTNAVTDGAGSIAAFSDPAGICVDGGGSIFISEVTSNVIRKVTYVTGDPGLSASYVVTTIAGAANVSGSIDGAGSAARFNGPFGLYADTDGKTYVADTKNDTIRVIARSGANAYSVSTLAGTALSTGTTDGTGAAARFSLPTGICGDTVHNLYVSDFSNNRIRRISPQGVVVTLIGTTAGLVDGPNGQLNHPIGLTVDSFGNILVCDTNNNAVRTVQRLISDGQPP